MKKNYLFPHYFQWIGWTIAIASFVVLLLGVINDITIRMPALYVDVFFDDDNKSGFFRMTESSMYSIAMPLLIIALIFIGFSKERVEDEFVQYIRSHSIVPLQQRRRAMKNRLKVARAEKDLTQEDLAHRIGVSRQSINAIESGRYVPSTVLALKMAQVFGKPVEEIFFLEENE